MPDARVAVLASGEGSNLQALLDDALVGSWVRLVVSDRENAPALQRAADAGVPAEFLDPRRHPERSQFDRALLDLLAEHDIGFVVCAGYMRILGAEIVKAFPDRIINIHPSLLPAFPGTNAVADALGWGVKVTGVTVHLVDEEVDHGPIVLQESVPLLREDDELTLRARIHDVEHALFRRAVRAMVEGRLEVVGRTVHVLPEAHAR